jgi:Ca2+-binding RTX toxin-like protein
MATIKWKTQVLVNTTTLGNQYLPRVEALEDGGFVIVWLDDGPAEDVIRWQRFDEVGDKVGSEQTVTTAQDLGNQSQPDVVQLEGGDIWIVQRDFDGNGSDIEGAVFNLDGSLVRHQEPFVSASISTLWPRVASLGPGGAVAVFQNNDADGSDIQMRIADISGVLGVNTTVNTNGPSLGAQQTNPSVSISPDLAHFVVTWTDYGLTDGDIRARVFDATGVEVTAEFGVNGLTTSTQQNAEVVWLNPAQFVTVWDTSHASGDGSGFAVKYVIRNIDGSTVGTERLANGATFSTQGAAAVTALPDGGFAIAWVDFSGTGGDTSLSSLKLQVFDGAGNKRGGEMLVNTTTDSYQVEVAMDTLNDGRIIATWRDDSGEEGDTSLGAVRAQIIDPRDGEVNGDDNANVLYGNDSFGDSITGFGGDDILHGLSGADTLYGNSGADQANGGRGDDTIHGGSGADRLFGNSGDDDVYGDAGDDSIYLGRGEDFGDGGDGFDTLSYFAHGQSAIIDMSNQAANAGAALDHTFTRIERINGSDLGADTLSGDDSANYLVGYGGVDTLIGNSGDDTLRGGSGADILSGGVGADKYRYDAVSEGGDTISSLSSIDDFQFLRTAFGNLAGGNVDSVNFLSRASGNTATTAAHRFIFDQSTDTLWYDANGSVAGGLTMIADIGSNTTLTHLDLLLV